MKNNTPATPARPPIFWRRFVPLSFAACLLASSGRAEAPTLGVWTGDQTTITTSSGTFDTNRWYAAARSINIQAGVETDASFADVSVTGLTATCFFPASVSSSDLDLSHGFPYYAQWNAAYTGLVCRLAQPLTNGQWWSSSVELIDSNAWARPLVSAKRTAAPTRFSPGVETVQTVVCDVFVPPGALSGMAIFSIQPFSWDLDAGGLGISFLSNSCSSADFQFDPSFNAFVCTYPDALAGAYSFTNYIQVTSYSARTVSFAPGIQVSYSRTQTDWGIRSSLPSRSLEHVYDNGLWVGLSSPIPALWDNQQVQDGTYLDIGSLYAPADSAPGLTQCFMFRTQSTGYDGRRSPRFFVSAEGTNLVEATLTVPDGTPYAMEIESDQAEFDLASLNENDLARFTNGTYTVRLYDAAGSLRQTYAVPLSGTPVAETPQLTAPSALCNSDPQPDLSWNAPSDTNVNATVLQIENSTIEDSIFNLWMQDEQGDMTHQFHVSQDLSACWTYDLIFTHAANMNVNGANVMAGHLSETYGFFNVATQNIAFVHVDADAPRVFAGDVLNFGLTSFGFLPGSNHTCTVDFGDGTATNAEWGVHQYAQPGTYTARVVVRDNTGAAATGTVSMTAYALPALSGVHCSSSGDVATLAFPTIDGASYSLIYKDSLLDADWLGTGSGLMGDGTSQTLDDYPGTSVTQRFYRLQCTLNPTTVD